MIGKNSLVSLEYKFFLRQRNILASILYSMITLLLPTFALVTINHEWSFNIDFLFVTFKPWRLYLIICGIPSLFWALVLIFVVPESPKFTFAQGSTVRTLKILQQMYSMNTGKPLESFNVKGFVNNEEFDGSFRNKSEGFFHFMWSQSVPLFKRPHLRNILTACYIQFAACNAANGFWTFLPEILNKLSLWSEASKEPATVCEVFTAITVVNNQHEKECLQKLELNTFLHVYEIATAYALSYGIMSLAINKTGKLILLLIIVWSTGIAAFLLIFVQIPVVSSYLYMTLILAGLAIGIVNASSVELFPTSMR